MTYSNYIKKDYKVETTTSKVCSHRTLATLLCGISLIFVSAWIMITLNKKHSYHGSISNFSKIELTTIRQDLTSESKAEAIKLDAEDIIIRNTAINDVLNNSVGTTPDSEELISGQDLSGTIEQHSNKLAQRITVKSGDSLALIFSRLGLSSTSLYNIISLGREVSSFKRLQPGQILNFYINENKLERLDYEINLTKSLSITKKNGKFQAELVNEELESIVKHSKATINDSLFLSAKRVGLSDKLIMQLISIYGWDIDFALDIREGDSFTLIYLEQQKDGVKVADGPIIAAEFINRGVTLRALRYSHEDGRHDYYSENGDAMRKAFLRTPLELARITSRFNLKRKHPILNTIRAHKGVDYAASIGTPIKATGNGTVTLVAKKGSFGRTIILKHGGKYSTLYAHLHKYARGIRKGKRVTQGQIIGYVGKSGLANGPHLHYEFRVNGEHQNPLTVNLPRVKSIDVEALPKFLQTIKPMIAKLDKLTGKRTITSQQKKESFTQSRVLKNDG